MALGLSSPFLSSHALTAIRLSFLFKVLSLAKTNRGSLRTVVTQSALHLKFFLEQQVPGYQHHRAGWGDQALEYRKATARKNSRDPIAPLSHFLGKRTGAWRRETYPHLHSLLEAEIRRGPKLLILRLVLSLSHIGKT